ncbi:hypothetical protein BDV19DRAFT_260799 [Aspergillus venezuelensis]
MQLTSVGRLYKIPFLSWSTLGVTTAGQAVRAAGRSFDRHSPKGEWAPRPYNPAQTYGFLPRWRFARCTHRAEAPTPWLLTFGAGLGWLLLAHGICQPITAPKSPRGRDSAPYSSASLQLDRSNDILAGREQFVILGIVASGVQATRQARLDPERTSRLLVGGSRCEVRHATVQ